MRKISLLLAILLSKVLFAQAQAKNGKVSGSIKDSSQKNPQSATIAILKAKDSSSVKFAVANSNGDYEFVNIPVVNVEASPTMLVQQQRLRTVLEKIHNKINHAAAMALPGMSKIG